MSPTWNTHVMKLYIVMTDTNHYSATSSTQKVSMECSSAVPGQLCSVGCPVQNNMLVYSTACSTNVTK